MSTSTQVQPQGGSGLKLESLHAHFEAEIREIDKFLVEYLGQFNDPGSLYPMIRYHFGYADEELRPLSADDYLPRGKRLRPLICSLFCRLYKLPRGIATFVMMAVELMHAASLAHDDIEDQDTVRWGRPTVHAFFGTEQGINIGDAMIGLVYHSLISLRDEGVPPETRFAVFEIFNYTHLRMCEGQHLDLTYKYYDDVKVADYLDMVSRKTASPCVCIADAISVLADSPPDTRACLHRFGESLGVLYQICDDIRGLWSGAEALGRQIGQDVSQHRASLPLLYAFQHGSPELRRLLKTRSPHSEPLTHAEIAEIRRELKAVGVHERCLRDATHYYGDAMSALDELPMRGPEVDILRAILSTCFASVEFAV